MTWLVLLQTSSSPEAQAILAEVLDILLIDQEASEVIMTTYGQGVLIEYRHSANRGPGDRVDIEKRLLQIIAKANENVEWVQTPIAILPLVIR